ncbi:fructose-6-phosphate aldolase [Siminovitchia acidinfaciens]|uniref:Fructose-6-phosphate aldolase n=1 Tax=Siminovitchia acidinfaciens TaxID=2321395 RepID=A0A429Y405_9BACI|nr:transaldolase family protein [Siminovitchia acidinfaciens]RST76152.1 fructose-6-phosphate aldolase [Siminovitchia acidinfaciens]
MLLVIDTANAEDIKELVDYFPIDGVTTNPSIIVKEKKNFLDVLEDIRVAIGNDRELFVQTLAMKAEDIVEEAMYVIEKVPGKTVIKIPATTEGVKAIKEMTSLGIRTMATTIYTPLQGYIAAKAGASYLTPYVNRIDNLPGDGVQVVRDLIQIVEKHQFDSQVLAASFKNIQQVLDVCVDGAHGVTLAPDLIKQLLLHPSTEANVGAFSDDWHKAFGERTLIDLSGAKI